MQTISQILELKGYGIDCSEDESARIKRVVKNNLELPESQRNNETLNKIQKLFPLQYNEAVNEFKNES